MQIEEAKQDLKYYIEEDPFYNGTYTPETDFEKYCHNLCKAIDTVLNELERLKDYEQLEWQEFNELSKLSFELGKRDKRIKELEIALIDDDYKHRVELEKKDKIINEMAKMINSHDIDEDVCKQMGKNKECNDYVLFESNCIDCIKEYFTNKVEKEGKQIWKLTARLSMNQLHMQN